MDLHGEIMNIRCVPLTGAYGIGHRDARHAAAELAIALDAKYAALMESHRGLLAALKEVVDAVDYDHYRGEIMSNAAEAIRKAEALGGE